MLKIDHVYFSYTTQPPYILNDLCLTVSKGDYISIVGENGCGKSTLLHLLLGFLHPDSGTIQINAKSIRYVAQKTNFSQIGFPITVYEVLNAYRKLLKIKTNTIIENVLQQTDMLPFKNCLMDTLSGGQTQRIALARALIGEPDLVILDEPSTGVDLKNQKKIYTILKELNIKQQLTILSVEHNLDAAIKNSTQIYHFAHGAGHICSPQKYAQEFFHSTLKESAYVTI
jgi:zinc transport system ATP-binding protein